MARRELPGSSLVDRVERPKPGDAFGNPVAVDYTFGFVDISGFTTYCEREGEHAAIALLTHFRFLTRSIAVRRGVRIAKWLGDGVMLVAADQSPMVATCAELLIRCGGTGLDTHVGLARGAVLLFEGDDYVGRSVNLAARLCDAADKREMLAWGLTADVPEWIDVDRRPPIALAGLGSISEVQTLCVHPDIVERFTRPGTAA